MTAAVSPALVALRRDANLAFALPLVSDVEASRAFYHGARLSLAAQTAKAYFAVVESSRQVKVAEDITARFLNVISLFNGTIPLIAIQFRAVRLDEKGTRFDADFSFAGKPRRLSLDVSAAEGVFSLMSLSIDQFQFTQG